MYIDGTKDSEIKIESMISWDVMNGLVRRSWARNSGAISTRYAKIVSEWTNKSIYVWFEAVQGYYTCARI